MKRTLLIVLVVVLTTLILLTGCKGSIPSTPPVIEEPPFDLELIKEYTGGKDYLRRWKNGVVSVVDETGRTGFIWDQINEIINGPVFFEEKTDVPSEQYIWIHYSTTRKLPVGWYMAEFHWDEEDLYFVDWEICFSEENALDDESMYTGLCLLSIGIKPKIAFKEGLTPAMKQVIYWMHRIDPGSPLLDL